MRDRRAWVEDRLAKWGLLSTLSVARIQLDQVATRLLREYASGDLLEAGSGRSPYRETVMELTTSVTRLDIDQSRGPDLVGDVQDMDRIEDESYDTVLSTQVLEHVSRPHDAMQEFRRVLREGGILIMTVPHLSIVHDAPNDYFRYTEFGLRALCERAGFQVLRVEPIGGLLSLVGHLLSLGLMTVFAPIPFLFWPVWALNYLFSKLLELIERPFGFGGVLPRDLAVVARAVAL